MERKSFQSEFRSSNQCGKTHLNTNWKDPDLPKRLIGLFPELDQLSPIPRSSILRLNDRRSLSSHSVLQVSLLVLRLRDRCISQPRNGRKICGRHLSRDREFQRLGTCSNSQIDTIYFGGGTPSLLSPGQLERDPRCGTQAVFGRSRIRNYDGDESGYRDSGMPVEIQEFGYKSCELRRSDF